MKNMNKLNLKEDIMQRIKTGQVSIKPKSFFIFKNLSVKGGLAAIMLIIVAIISFVIYIGSQLPGTQLLGLNDKAFWSVLANLPFGLILFVVLLAAFFLHIYRQNTMAYRRRLSYSISGFIGLILLISVIFTYSGIHQGLAVQAEEYDSALLKTIYQKALSCQIDEDNILIGKLVDYNRNEKTAQVLDLSDQLVTLQWFEDTEFANMPKIGDTFVTAGYKDGNIFYTQIIRSIPLNSLKDRCFAPNNSLK